MHQEVFSPRRRQNLRVSLLALKIILFCKSLLQGRGRNVTHIFPVLTWWVAPDIFLTSLLALTGTWSRMYSSGIYLSNDTGLENVGLIQNRLSLSCGSGIITSVPTPVWRRADMPFFSPVLVWWSGSVFLSCFYRHPQPHAAALIQRWTSKEASTHGIVYIRLLGETWRCDGERDPALLWHTTRYCSHHRIQPSGNGIIDVWLWFLQYAVLLES